MMNFELVVKITLDIEDIISIQKLLTISTQLCDD